jgi:hypothetical protein
MIFYDPSAVIAYSVLIILIALGVIGFRYAQRKTGANRMFLRVGSFVVVAGGLLITAAWRLGAALTSFSPPIYSPDHKYALRVADENIDSRGVTRVYLYSDHGLVVKQVFQGRWKSAKAEDIHWLSNSEVSILYEYSSDKYVCASTSEVRVSAQRKF